MKKRVRGEQAGSREGCLVVTFFPSWRLQITEVAASLRTGRLEEARRQLTTGRLLEFLPAQEQAQKLALAFAARAQRRAATGDLAGGWRDWEAAVSLSPVPACEVARRCLVEAEVREVARLAASGNWLAARTLLAQLDLKSGGHAQVGEIREILQFWQAARQAQRNGSLSEASLQWSQALEKAATDKEIHQLLKGDWDRCRGRTQQATKREVDAQSGQGGAMGDERDSELGNQPRSERTTPQDCLLWIDGVGGYLICFRDTVTLGQVGPENRVEVPIVGDLSRQHARIRRVGEGYVLEPLQATAVNGQPLRQPAILVDGDELTLGTSVRMRFRRPHPLSATARLEPLSRHRTHPYTDGVLLMADSCILGPRWTNHVVCRDWEHDVVLYRQEGQLYLRAPGPLEIDGRPEEGRGKLQANSRVVGQDFSLSLEDAGKERNWTHAQGSR